MSRVRKVVLAHDWLNGMRGGERCLDLICQEYPQADLYTLLFRPELVSDAIRNRKVHVSGLQRVPGFRAHYRWFLPLFPMAIESFRVPADVDLVLSTSHCVAKGLVPPPGARHLCYCFTPMRYAWSMQADYFGRNRFKRAVIDRMLARLRTWDRAASERVDRFVAISRHVQRRIEKYYGRESTVVYPPVATRFFTPDERGGHDGFDLIVSALVPYKRVDLAVRAYSQTGRPLKIAGVGTDLAVLKDIAAPTWHFSDMCPTNTSANCTAAAGSWCSRAKRTSGLCRSKRRPAANPSWPTAREACWKQWWPARPACSSINKRRKRWRTPWGVRSMSHGIRLPSAGMPRNSAKRVFLPDCARKLRR